MSLNTTPGWGKSGMSRMRARRAETSTAPAYRRFFLRGRGGMTVPDDVVLVVVVVLPEVAFGFGRALAAATPARSSNIVRERVVLVVEHDIGRREHIVGHLAALRPGRDAPADVLVARLALLEDGQQGRGDEDRRVGTGRQADEQRQAELLERGRAEDERADDEERHDRQQRRDRGVERPHQRLVQREVDHVAVGHAAAGRHEARVLVHLVEHDDAVVDRVAEDRQEGHDGGRGHLEARQRVDADRHEDVVHEGDQGGHGHLELEAERDVAGDDDQEDDERAQRLAADLVAPRRAHHLRRHHRLVDAGFLGQRLADRHRLVARRRRRLDLHAPPGAGCGLADHRRGHADARDGIARLLDGERL